MKQCPLCESTVSSSNFIHDCGYNFEKKEITDWERTRSLLKRRDLRWTEVVKLKRRANEIQVKKHGRKITRSKDAHGWSQKNTAEMIGESPANLSRDLDLAEALDTHPDLSKIQSKSKAMKRLKEIKTSMPAKDDTGFKKENELQEYLANNWDKTPFAEEWDIHNKWRKGKSYAGEAGEIDILARHKKEPKWLIIELKVERSSDVAVGQILRYMGWVKRNLARDDEVVVGLIISKSPDIETCYALVCTTNINYQLYRLEEGKIQLSKCDIDNYHISCAIKDMTLEERMEFASQLPQMKPY